MDTKVKRRSRGCCRFEVFVTSAATLGTDLVRWPTPHPSRRNNNWQRGGWQTAQPMVMAVQFRSGAPWRGPAEFESWHSMATGWCDSPLFLSIPPLCCVVLCEHNTLITLVAIAIISHMNDRRRRRRQPSQRIGSAVVLWWTSLHDRAKPERRFGSPLPLNRVTMQDAEW